MIIQGVHKELVRYVAEEYLSGLTTMRKGT